MSFSHAARVALVSGALVGCAGGTECPQGTEQTKSGDCSIAVGNVTEANYAEQAALAECAYLLLCATPRYYVDPVDVGAYDEVAGLYPQGDWDKCIDAWTGHYKEEAAEMNAAGCWLDEDAASECFNPGTCQEYGERWGEIQAACDSVWAC